MTHFSQILTKKTSISVVTFQVFSTRARSLIAFIDVPFTRGSVKSWLTGTISCNAVTAFCIFWVAVTCRVTIRSKGQATACYKEKIVIRLMAHPK